MLSFEAPKGIGIILTGTNLLRCQYENIEQLLNLLQGADIQDRSGWPNFEFLCVQLIPDRIRRADEWISWDGAGNLTL